MVLTIILYFIWGTNNIVADCNRDNYDQDTTENHIKDPGGGEADKEADFKKYDMKVVDISLLLPVKLLILIFFAS